MKGDMFANYPKVFSYFTSIESLEEEYCRVNRVSRSGYTFPATYPKEDKLTEYIQDLSEYKQKIDTGGATKKARIILSEDKRFTFSFDLASKGLYRVVEYYSDEVKNELGDLFSKNSTDETEIDGIVPPNFVQDIKNSQGDIVFFYKHIFDDGSAKEYILRRQQKGSAYMLTINPNAKLELSDDGIYYASPVSFILPNGKQFALTFSTTFRKIYLEQTQKGGSAKRVDIYIPFDMISGDIDRRGTPAVPLMILTEFFTQARIRVRLNIMRPIQTNVGGGGGISIVAIPFKDFDEPIDWNKLGVLRGMEQSGTAITEMNSSIQSKKVRGGVGAYASYLLYDMANELQYEFGQYKNWFYQEVEKENIKSPLVPKPLMIALSTEGLLGEYFNTKIDPNEPFLEIDKQFAIDDAVFYLMDMVDFYFNPKVEEIVKRIYERFERVYRDRKQRIIEFYDEAQKLGLNSSTSFSISSDAATELAKYNDADLFNNFNDYLNMVISRLFKDSFPDRGQYASTPEELKEVNTKYLTLLKRITTELPKYKI